MTDSNWSSQWQLTPVFLPRKFHGLRSLGATVQGVTKSLTRLSTHAHTHSQAQRTARISQEPDFYTRLRSIGLEAGHAVEIYIQR